MEWPNITYYDSLVMFEHIFTDFGFFGIFCTPGPPRYFWQIIQKILKNAQKCPKIPKIHHFWVIFLCLALKKYFKSRILVSFHGFWSKIIKNNQKIAIWRPKSAQIGLKKNFCPFKKIDFFRKKKDFFKNNRFFWRGKFCFSGRSDHFSVSKSWFLRFVWLFSLKIVECHRKTMKI